MPVGLRGRSVWHLPGPPRRPTIRAKEAIPMRALLAVDGSDASNRAVDAAAAMAWPKGATLEIVSVIPTDAELFGGPWPAAAYVQSGEVRAELSKELGRQLAGAADTVRRPGLDVTTTLAEGRPASDIVRRANQDAVDLVIVGARGHGTLERMVLGSVSAEVVERALCPVLVARGAATGRIVVGVDGSLASLFAVEFLGACGLWPDATVRSTTVIDVPAAWWLGITPVDAVVSSGTYVSVQAEATAHAWDMANDAVARLAADGFVADAAVREGDAAGGLIAEAATWGAGLIVVGTRGHGLIKRLLMGSTARNVLYHAPMSVLIVRPGEDGGDPAPKGVHR